VVVFRREEPKTLQKMDVKLDGLKDDAEPVPTIYRFDLTEPQGMFLAQRMQLHNGDVVYASAHPFSDFTKLLGALRDVLLIQLLKK
jgi:polysaccharide biosynthesis/export protein